MKTRQYYFQSLFRHDKWKFVFFLFTSTFLIIPTTLNSVYKMENYRFIKSDTIFSYLCCHLLRFKNRKLLFHLLRNIYYPYHYDVWQISVYYFSTFNALFFFFYKFSAFVLRFYLRRISHSFRRRHLGLLSVIINGQIQTIDFKMMQHT